MANERGSLREVMSVAEVAEFLRVNVKTVYEALHLGGLPGRRVGRRRIVISRAALLRWLEQGRVSPSENEG